MDVTALQNNKGVALVISLLFTLISLTIIMSLLLMMEHGAKTSGASKRYKTSLEAAYGGNEIIVKDVLPMIMQNMSSSAELSGKFAGISMSTPSGTACLKAKLTLPTSKWPIGCSSSSNTKQSPDISFNLLGTSGTSSFTVYSKIIDTVKGNTDTSGLELDTHSVAESTPVLTPQHFPFVYRVEVQGERTANAVERAVLSVLYAY